MTPSSFLTQIDDHAEWRVIAVRRGSRALLASSVPLLLICDAGGDRIVDAHGEQAHREVVADQRADIGGAGRTGLPSGSRSIGELLLASKLLAGTVSLSTVSAARVMLPSFIATSA